MDPSEYVPKKDYDNLLKMINQLIEMLKKSQGQTDELIKIIMSKRMENNK
jgi:hypothetical protein